MPDCHRPDDEAARVTDAARFAVLAEAAETLLYELDRRFVVERRETKEPQPDGSTIRSVCLIPRTLVSAPLAIDFPDTPGVVLRLGRWFRQSLPSGDACGEQPDDVVGQLRKQAGALVEGGLWECVRRGVGGSWAEARLVGPAFRVGRRVPLDARAAREARREGFAAAVQWGPWPARPEKMS